MAGQNDFLIFDENSENILTQELYASDDDREDGFKTGLARSNVNNKVLRQTSIMASAIGDLVSKQGGQASDTSKSSLVSNLNKLFSIKKYYSDATYDLDDVVIVVGEEVNLYRSLVNNNTGNAVSDTTKWENIELGGGALRNVGEIVASTIPLTDAGLHLLDGALLQGSGSYAEFVTYIAGLRTNYSSLFTTESAWQSSVTDYGVCNKFVYDSVNNTLRLPKYGNQIYTKSITSTAPVKGNGMALGLSNGTHQGGLGDNTSSNSYLVWSSGYYGSSAGSTTSVSVYNDHKSLGVTTDSTKSGVITDLSNITTALDCYYYIVAATSTKTNIEVDIDEIATDLNGKMDKDGLNAVNSVKFADGQWVSSPLLAFDVSTKGTYTADLSNYLPNDNYKYEIYCFGLLQTQNVNLTEITLNNELFIQSDAYATSNNEAKSNTGSVIIDNTRTLSMTIAQESGNPNSVKIRLIRYRRIGTNQ